MIKNAKELDNYSREMFKKSYIKYFKNVCVYEYRGLPNVLNKTVLRLYANKYVEEMLRRIELDYSTSYVSITDDVDAFITAYTEGKYATISHIYSKDNIESNKDLQNVYKELVEDLRSQGIERIGVSSSKNDQLLMELLDSLNFNVENSSQDEIEYSKRLEYNNEHHTI